MTTVENDKLSRAERTEIQYRSTEYYQPLDEVITLAMEQLNADGPIGMVVCVDGPSAAGKRQFGRMYSQAHPNILAIDGDVFLRDRCTRGLPEDSGALSQIAPHSISVKDWHNLERQTEWLEGVINAKNLGLTEFQFDGTYRHDDPLGYANHQLQVALDFNILMFTGRYSLSPEIQGVIRSHNLPSLQIIMDALPSQRLQRVLERRKLWNTRDFQKQLNIQTQIVEPDWAAYFPTVFSQSDYYVTTNGSLTIRRPEEAIDLNAVWGCSADLVITDQEVSKLNEIGSGGATSVYRHSQRRKLLYVVEGPLAIQIGEEPDLKEQFVLQRGDGFMIPVNTWHRASSYEGSIPLYYEYQTFIQPEAVGKFEDIETAQPAVFMNGDLRFLHGKGIR